MTTPYCTCAACGRFRPQAAHGWCGACYRRWDRHGRPEDGPPDRKPLQPCGSDAGYQRHIKRGEDPCQPCQDARNADQRERRAKASSVPTGRDQWTTEETRTSHTIALATEGSPADRRLLLEVLGLVPSSATSATSARDAAA